MLDSCSWSVPHAGRGVMLHTGNQQTPSVVLFVFVFGTFRLYKIYICTGSGTKYVVVVGLRSGWAYRGCRSGALGMYICYAAAASASAGRRGDNACSGSDTISARRRCAGWIHDREDAEGGYSVAVFFASLHAHPYTRDWDLRPRRTPGDS